MKVSEDFFIFACAYGYGLNFSDNLVSKMCNYRG